ncbi:MAG: hypothetical protein WBL65_26750 [Bryobacteraceae bacterium]
MESPVQVDDATADLPLCDWVYFATPKRGSWTVTKDFVSEAKVILRSVYNKDGLRIANVSHLKPGDKVLLAYGGGGCPYRALFRCTVGIPAKPVERAQHSFDVFAYVDESLYDRLTKSHYEADPVLKKFTGISIAQIQDLRHITGTIPRPTGNNTLRRWGEVFPHRAESSRR